MSVSSLFLISGFEVAALCHKSQIADVWGGHLVLGAVRRLSDALILFCIVLTCLPCTSGLYSLRRNPKQPTKRNNSNFLILARAIQAKAREASQAIDDHIYELSRSVAQAQYARCTIKHVLF